MENGLTFAAVRGVQATRAFYIAMVPLGAVGRLFNFDEAGLPAELREQRELNRGRIPALVRYLVERQGDYVLPALTASIGGEFSFQPTDPDGRRSVGILSVDVEATLLLNDGQHRRAAIIQALHERPSLAHETIAVTFYADRGLDRSRQMFVDLNQHTVKPPRSLRLFFDSRDEVAAITRGVLKQIPILQALTDTSRSALSARSPRLFAFSSLAAATRITIEEAGMTASPDQIDGPVAFWDAVIKGMPDWRMAASGQLRPADLRQQKIHAHGIALEAIAVAGARALREYPNRWPAILARLADVDWSRGSADLWEGRALANGRINRTRASVLLMADVIWRTLMTEGPPAFNPQVFTVGGYKDAALTAEPG